MPVLLLQMPTSPDLRRFFLLTLRGLEVGGYCSSSSLPCLEEIVYRGLLRHKVQMLIIDELHNILSGTHRQQLEFLNLLRFIGNELQIPIVGVGTKDAYLAIRSDPQLENRFEPLVLPVWQEGREYDALLASFVRVLPLQKQSNLTEKWISNSILTMSEGIIGEIAAIIRRAAINAIYTGTEMIDELTLKCLSYSSPSQRRHLIEDALL